MNDRDRYTRLELRGLLNETQFQAATHLDGPLLIVAGAGSGKTRTLVHRVAWLVDQGIVPSSILLLTFARKAASEMLSRCASLVGDRAGMVNGGTFHSLANSILRRYAPKLGFSSQFGIMDQDDSETLIGRLRGEDPAHKGHAAFPKRNTIQNIFSQAVNKDTDVGRLMQSSFPHLLEFETALLRILAAYRRHKQENDLMDFDDLLVNLERLLAGDEGVRREIASRYSHILVDEYQDTNPIQARLTALLGRDHLNVTAVGDEAQSIYGFRGANFRNIMDFPDIFQGTKILTLEDNYRSHPQILAVANHLLSQARERFEKTLRANRPDGPPVKILLLDDTRDEAVTVAGSIEADLRAGLAPRDIAVLFRAGSHSFELESQLTKRRLAYSKYGGRKFLEMAHTKDYLCYLRLAVNPRDGQSLRRVLGHVDGLGPKGQEKAALWALGQEEYLSSLDQAPAYKDKARKSLSSLRDLLASICLGPLEPALVAKEVFDFYSGILPRLFPDDYPSRLQDLMEIRNMAAEAPDLVSFLADTTLDPPNTLVVGQGDVKDRNDLTLSTIHSAKGLEWPKVYVISAVEGRFPSAYVKSSQDIEEELRLMYVAVTRACDQLVVTMPLKDNWGGSPCPSRFLARLGPGLAEVFQNGRPTGTDSLSPYHGSLDFELLDEVMNSAHDLPKRAIGVQEAKIPPPRRAPGKARGKGAAPTRGEECQRPALGQRVSHPVFGPGSVVAMEGPRATIDFDQFGKKTILVQFAKLVPLSP
ncbi:MAG: ATP-dependent helicase [Deltaproteobacteria bacterium]|jgi:DNA helicase-2/ATP-dependent DNA helicase PcrA|nr:ATP-dependent helicase [Deltaproteobacteria bacterium]